MTEKDLANLQVKLNTLLAIYVSKSEIYGMTSSHISLEEVELIKKQIDEALIELGDLAKKNGMEKLKTFDVEDYVPIFHQNEK